MADAMKSQNGKVVVVDLGGMLMEMTMEEVDRSIDAVKFNRVRFPNEAMYAETLGVYEEAKVELEQ